jgi:hypothetical protein
VQVGDERTRMPASVMPECVSGGAFGVFPVTVGDRRREHFDRAVTPVSV